MNQVSNWLDMSQIYNSRRKYFDDVNRDKKDKAKLLTDPGATGLDGDKKFMPRCPLGSR